MSHFTEPLAKSHKKSSFSSGKEMLDSYIQHQATQDIKKKLSACFVHTDDKTGIVKGYYTLSNNSIPLNQVPENIRKKLPKSYKTVPTTLLGRLAVDNNFQGQGIGKYLLIDALKRSYETSKQIGSLAVIVDPLDEEAERFYEKYGFIKLPDSGKMFLPMKTIQQLFS